MRIEYWLECLREHERDARRWENKDLQGMVSEGMEWIYLAQDKVGWRQHERLRISLPDESFTSTAPLTKVSLYHQAVKITVGV